MRTECKKLFTILAVLCLLQVFALSSYGQLGQITDRPAKSYVPASPNVAQLQKYGDIPVNYSSGLPSISLPVWTLKLKDFAWPVSLSYHSAGMQVSEVASSVGLGWTLNAGGVISSKVIDENDLSHFNWADTIKRTLETGGVNGFGGLCVFYNEEDQDRADLLTQENVNSLPDLYYLNTALVNGKFFMRNDTGYCMPRTNLQIKFNRHGSGSILLSNFTVTDESGNKFYFEKVGGNETSNNCTSGLQSSPSNLSFYLTKIVTYAGEEILFSYTEESIVYSMPGSQTVYERLSLDCGDCIQHHIASNTCTTTFTSTEQRLDKITTSTGEVINFYYSSRSDLPGGTKLDSIKIGVWNELGTLAKYKKVFVNSYFGSGAATAMRLRLDEYKSVNVDASQAEKHVFTYSTVTVPDRLSKAVDYFGYYNGQTGNTSLLIDSSNRVPDTAYSKAGMLLKITYPTGGHTSFTYEYNYLGGGHRILKIDDVVDGTVAKTRSFQYSPNSFPNYQPSFEQSVRKFYLKTSQSPIGNVCNGAGISGSCYVVYYCDYIMHTTSPSSNTYTQFVTYKKYDTVREYHGPSGTGGYVEYVYDYPKTPTGGYKVTDIANIEGQLINKRVFEKIASGYRVLSEEKSTYEVLEDQLAYFSEATDSREKNAWGIEVFLDKQQFSGECDGPQPYCYPATYFQGNFKLVSTPLFLKSQQSVTYTYTSGGTQQTMTQTVDYSYEDNAHCAPTKTTTTQSDGKQLINEVRYPTSYATFGGLTTDETNALSSMLSANNIATPFYTQVKVDGTVTGKIFSSYKLSGGKAYITQIRKYPSGTSTFVKTDYTQPDSKCNIQEITGPDGVTVVILYNTKNNAVIADVANASLADVAYTSFEGDDKGGWTYTATAIADPASRTGMHKYWMATGGITKSGLTSGTTYLLSYWTTNGSSYSITGTSSTRQGKTIGGWTFFEHTITGVTSVSISGTNYIDELRLHPKGAQMNSYTYDLLIGMTSQCNANEQIGYYEYDWAGRLLLIRDEERNVLKKFCYNYAGQPDSCGIYYSQAQSQAFTRNNCGPDSVGNSITYSVPAGKYSGYTLAEANAKALAEIAAFGQANANAKGTCTLLCTVSNCSGVNLKCVNNICEAGIKVYTDVIQIGLDQWQCVYHYEWSDGSWSQNYVEESPTPCEID